MGVRIEVINLNAWYGTNHRLQDIGLNIPARPATAVIGSSGCGKGTFVRCSTPCRDRPSPGHGDRPHRRPRHLPDATPVEIRRRVGMVFQRPNPFPTMSIYDNVAAGLKLNGYSDQKPSTKWWKSR